MYADVILLMIDPTRLGPVCWTESILEIRPRRRDNGADTKTYL